MLGLRAGEILILQISETFQISSHWEQGGEGELSCKALGSPFSFFVDSFSLGEYLPHEKMIHWPQWMVPKN
jgi:hypothetical protein